MTAFTWLVCAFFPSQRVCGRRGGSEGCCVVGAGVSRTLNSLVWPYIYRQGASNGAQVFVFKHFMGRCPRLEAQAAAVLHGLADSSE